MILSSPNHPVVVDKVTIWTLTALENPLHSTRTPSHQVHTPSAISSTSNQLCKHLRPSSPHTTSDRNIRNNEVFAHRTDFSSNTPNGRPKLRNEVQPATNQHLLFLCSKTTTTQKSVGLQASPLWDVAVCNGIHYTHSLAGSRIKACLQLHCSTYLPSC